MTCFDGQWAQMAQSNGVNPGSNPRFRDVDSYKDVQEDQEGNQTKVIGWKNREAAFAVIQSSHERFSHSLVAQMRTTDARLTFCMVFGAADSQQYLATADRTEELARLQARAKRRKPMLVFGPEGVGKTRLIE